MGNVKGGNTISNSGSTRAHTDSGNHPISTPVPKRGEVSLPIQGQESQEEHQIELKLNHISELVQAEQVARYEKLDETGIVQEIRTNLEELKSLPGADKLDFKVIEERVGVLGEEYREELVLVDTLRNLSEENLTREQLNQRLSENPIINQEEALKVLAKLELEQEAGWYKGSLRIIANKRDGEEALKLDIRTIPG